MTVFGSIRSLVLTSIATTALVVALVIVLQMLQTRKVAVNRVSESAAQTARDVSYSQGRLLQSGRDFLVNLSSSKLLEIDTIDACSDLLNELLKINTTFINIGLPDAQGNLLCNALPLPTEPINVFDRAYFQRSFTLKQFSISEFQVDRAANKVSINLSYPVFDSNENVTAIVVGVISLDWWNQQLSTLLLPKDTIVFIADADQKVVAVYPDTELSSQLTISFFGILKGHLVDAKSADGYITGSDGVLRLFHHDNLFTTPDGRTMTVSVGIPIKPVLKDINDSFGAALVLLFFSILFFGYLIYVLIQYKVIRPLALLLDATRSLKRGELIEKQSDYKGSAKEVRQLQQRFQDMAVTRVTAERAAMLKNSELQSVIQSLPDDYFRLGKKAEIIELRRIQDSALAVLDDAIGCEAWRAIHGLKKSQFKRLLSYNTDDQLTQVFEFDQHESHFECRLSSVIGVDEFIMVIRDLTQKKKREQVIWQQANYDSLTELPNRAYLSNALDREIRQAKRQGTSVALLTIDLDNFKDINDSLGHQYGDQVLMAAADRIKNIVRESDVVARLGGDEFTVVLTGLHQETKDIEVAGITKKILSSIGERIEYGDVSRFITASVGVAYYPSDTDNIVELFKMSDQAMYAAKTAGRNKFRVFNESMQVYLLEQIDLGNDLHGAIEKNQFEMYYQPIINLSTGQIEKAEALIRWFHPERGMVPPDEFIPVAEKTHLISDIGEWVFDDCAHQLMAMQQAYPDIQVSINISPAQIMRDPDVIKGWPDKLKEKGVGGHSLVAEITESLLLIDNKETHDAVASLRQQGVQIAIDDFGTGYSSLAYLMKYGIDYIKIDRSFVGSMSTSHDAFALCETIVLLAKKLGIKVVAEGIETAEQLSLLIDLGCEFGQGYYFSKPIPAQQFMQLLASEKSYAEDPNVT